MRPSKFRSRLAAAMGLIAALSLHTAASADTKVFRCELKGIVTFSDRPCGPDAEVHEPDTARVSTFAAPPLAQPSRVRQPTPRKKDITRTESIAALQAKHRERCTHIDRSLRDIRSKMRAGYDAKQGERLNERHRKLNRQRRDEKC